ncbi:hypothetical protein, partial [Clostridium botulinum]|uniref:hypothetical protein n=1 Tax=Clostridium botulinum TaxID=1491 RepID=UPI001A9A5841
KSISNFFFKKVDNAFLFFLLFLITYLYYLIKYKILYGQNNSQPQAPKKIDNTNDLLALNDNPMTNNNIIVAEKPLILNLPTKIKKRYSNS